MRLSAQLSAVKLEHNNHHRRRSNMQASSGIVRACEPRSARQIHPHHANYTVENKPPRPSMRFLEYDPSKSRLSRRSSHANCSLPCIPVGDHQQTRPGDEFGRSRAGAGSSDEDVADHEGRAVRRRGVAPRSYDERTVRADVDEVRGQRGRRSGGGASVAGGLILGSLLACGACVRRRVRADAPRPRGDGNCHRRW